MERMKYDGLLLGHLIAFALVLMVAGAFLIVAGLFLSGGEVSGGAVIFIGPIPIVLGGGPLGEVLALAVVVMAIMSLALAFILTRRRTNQRSNEESVS